jgi:serralysin
LMLAVAPGQADFTTWEVNEVFSNADGTIQFIEFFEANGQDAQRSFTGKDLKTFVDGAAPSEFLNRYEFTDDVSSNLTANKFALIATSGFASLLGAVPPDFVMPDGFIDTSVVVKITLSTIDEFTFAQGAIPIDGVDSLHRTGTPVGPNSPTNFAGQTGNIDVPEPTAAALEAAALLCVLGIVQIRRAVGVPHYPASAS